MADNKYSDFGGRLKSARKLAGLTITALAANAGVSRPTIKDYEAGSAEPGIDKLHRIAGILSLSIEELWTGDSIPSPVTEQTSIAAHASDGYVSVPRYAIAASAGGGSLIESEQIVDYMTFRREYLELEIGMNPAHAVVISVAGDSMEPEIRIDDLLLIDMQLDTFVGDGIYVLRIDGALFVKRLGKMKNGGIRVSSDNPVYPPETYEREELNLLCILGRVVLQCKKK